MARRITPSTPRGSSATSELSGGGDSLITLRKSSVIESARNGTRPESISKVMEANAY